MRVLARILLASLTICSGVQAQPHLFVAERNAGHVAKINLTDGSKTTLSGNLGGMIGLTSDRKGRLFVGRFDAESVDQIELLTGQARSISTGHSLHGLWADPDQDVLYVAGFFDNCVYTLTEEGDSTWTRTVLQDNLGLPVGVLRHEENLYITERNTNRLSVKNLVTGQWQPLLSLASPDIIAREPGGDLLIGSGVNGSIYRVNLSPPTLVKTYPGFASPYGILFDPADGTLLVSEHFGNKITRLNLDTEGKTTVSDQVGVPWQAALAFCNDKPDGTPCDDGNACTLDEACLSSTCTGGLAVKCGSSQECQSSSCDPWKGCVDTPAADGTPCLDGSCQAGQCSGGAGGAAGAGGDNQGGDGGAGDGGAAGDSAAGGADESGSAGDGGAAGDAGSAGDGGFAGTAGEGGTAGDGGAAGEGGAGDAGASGGGEAGDGGASGTSGQGGDGGGGQSGEAGVAGSSGGDAGDAGASGSAGGDGGSGGGNAGEGGNGGQAGDAGAAGAAGTAGDAGKGGADAGTGGEGAGGAGAPGSSLPDLWRDEDAPPLPGTPGGTNNAGGETAQRPKVSNLTPYVREEAGCSCALPASSPGRGWGALAVLAAWLGRRRRR